MGNLYFNTEKSVFRFDPSLQNVVWKSSGGSITFLEGEQVIRASLESDSAPTFALDIVQFGDGYDQVTESGINAVRDHFNVKFDKKNRAITYALQRFFKGESTGSIYNRRVSEWFWWLPPYPFYQNSRNKPVKVRCEEYSCSPVDYDAWTTSVKLIQSFEP